MPRSETRQHVALAVAKSRETSTSKLGTTIFAMAEIVTAFMLVWREGGHNPHAPCRFQDDPITAGQSAVTCLFAGCYGDSSAVLQTAAIWTRAHAQHLPLVSRAVVALGAGNILPGPTQLTARVRPRIRLLLQ